MTTKKLTHLSTARAVVEAFKTNAQLRTVTNVGTPQAITNWLARDGFPPQHFLAMTSWLAEHGYSADPALWGQHVSEESATKEPSTAARGAVAPV